MIMIKVLNISLFLLSIALLAFSSYPNKTPDSLSDQFVITTPNILLFVVLPGVIGLFLLGLYVYTEFKIRKTSVFKFSLFSFLCLLFLGYTIVLPMFVTENWVGDYLNVFYLLCIILSLTFVYIKKIRARNRAAS